jgi:hypothetical protein
MELAITTEATINKVVYLSVVLWSICLPIDR